MLAYLPFPAHQAFAPSRFSPGKGSHIRVHTSARTPRRGARARLGSSVFTPLDVPVKRGFVAGICSRGPRLRRCLRVTCRRPRVRSFCDRDRYERGLPVLVWDSALLSLRFKGVIHVQPSVLPEVMKIPKGRVIPLFYFISINSHQRASLLGLCIQRRVRASGVPTDWPRRQLSAPITAQLPLRPALTSACLCLWCLWT